MRVSCVVMSVRRIDETDDWRVALRTGKGNEEAFILTVPAADVETFVLKMVRGTVHYLEIAIT